MTEQDKEVSPEETLVTLMYVQEAIINVLEQKGLATREEIMAEVKQLAAKHAKPKH